MSFFPHTSAGGPPNTNQSISESESHAYIDPEALVSSKHDSLFADIDWERSLQGRLEEVVHYGLTLVPYEELFSLATKKAYPKAWPIAELSKYLCSRLRYPLDSKHAESILHRSQSLYLGYTEAFITQFCLELKKCCTDLREQSQGNDNGGRQEILWVYTPKYIEPECIRQLPPSITDPLKYALAMLEDHPGLMTDDTTFGGDIFQMRSSMANSSWTLDMGAWMEAWRREGYHEHLLRRYAWYRMIKQVPSRQREVNLFVSQLFDKPWEKRHWEQTADRTDEPDLRIHYLR